MGRRRADGWSRRARAEGWAARSVYKLEEIDRRTRLLDGARRVLDLGCAPGSWSAWVRRRLGPGAALVGVDLQDVPGYPGRLLRASVLEVEPAALRDLLGGPADVVLSDMAPRTSGARDADHFRQLELARAAADLARALLVPGGRLLAKVFDGPDAPAFLDELRADFEAVRRLRPRAVRSESREFFVLGRRRGGG